MRLTPLVPLTLASLVATTLLVTACGGGADDSLDLEAGTPPNATTLDTAGAGTFSLTLQKIGSTVAGGLAAAEINAYDARTGRLFVTDGANARVNVFDPRGVTDLGVPASPAAFISIADLGATVNSVAVHDGLVAVAVEAAPKTAPGVVAFYRADTLERLAVVTVGAQPDMLVFTRDGRRVLVANEGEPDSYGLPTSVDPEGSVSVIDLHVRGSTLIPTVRTADFRGFNGQIDALRARGVRIYGPGATVAQDLEPEYIALDPDGRLAYVTLQENNAVATVDIARAKVLAIQPLGLKDHNLPGQGLDPSDEDGGTDTNSGTPAVKIGNWPVLGLYLPDAMAAYKARGQTWLVTANEGDARADWPGFNEEVRIRAHCDKGLDPTVFPGATGDATDRLLRDSNLGRLRVTLAPNGNDNGKNAAGQCNKLLTYGSRSFSIWRAADMKRVFDSGEDFERLTAAIAEAVGAPFKFNSGHDNDTLDSRSPAKGPEPEAVAVGEIGGRTYAFIGLERVGGIMVYDVTDPFNARFETYINTRNGATGDLGPEGVTFVPAGRSPIGKALVIVSHEVSGTTAVYEVKVSRGGSSQR
ncbi:MAG: choice-of-anchor I family protein [Rubrivivax sp.]|nr:choice-of-anchor I family protein [Rubrivivax sp.]